MARESRARKSDPEVKTPAIRSLSVAKTHRPEISDVTTRQFLTQAGKGRSITIFTKGDVIFAQGDPANSLFYLQTGRVKLSVVSNGGREAVIAIQDAGVFFGEGCLTAQNLRMSRATAMTDCSVMQMEKAAVVQLLRDQPAFSEMLLSYILTRTVRIEADLVDQLFNSSEKRLARALLLLANFGQDSAPQTVIAKISQETLAEMIGTTRSRVSFFMNKFRRLGFIKYNGTMEVHSSLLNVVLHD